MHIAAYLAVRRTPTLGGLGILGLLALTFVAGYYRIFVVYARHSGCIEIAALRATINGIGRAGTAFGQAQQLILVNGCRRRYPLQQYATFPFTLGIALRGCERGNSGRFIEIQFRAMNSYREHGRGILEAQIGAALVDTYPIIIMGACQIRYIRYVRGPGTVFITADTILWHYQLDGRLILLHRTHQNQLGASIPHTTAVLRCLRHAYQTVIHLLVHGILDFVPASLCLFSSP